MLRPLIAFAAGLALLVQPALAQTAPDARAQTAAELRDRALKDPLAWEILEDLTTGIGPRPAGSPAMARAKDWAVREFERLGFTNIRVHEFAKPTWTRGEESAAIVAPYSYRLSILGLGGTVPTPKGGIEAEVVVFGSFAELLAAPEGSLKGKIAVVNQPMTKTVDGQGYSAAVRARSAGPIEAAKRGAVAYLVRSISTSDLNAPHTGMTRYSDAAPKIPAAALGVPDADLLQKLSRRGPVKVRINLASTTRTDTVAWNISGDIVGSEKPEEVVVIGGHLDSWDVGTGAHDDGAGIAITTAAAKLIGDLPRHPRRTIRVVMWGSEETGGSGEAFLADNKDNLANLVVASESDLGGDRIYALLLPKGAVDAPQLAALPALFAPLKIIISRDPAPFGGADVTEIRDAGVPVFTLRQDATRYFDLHHSPDDTIDKIDPVQLNQNVAAWAVLIYLIADSDIDFRALREAK